MEEEDDVHHFTPWFEGRLSWWERVYFSRLNGPGRCFGCLSPLPID